MKIEVLCPTMHQKDISKYKEMNLQTDAVIANQADVCAYSEYNVNGKRVRFATTNSRGVSINRNIAIAYSTADIIVFSDDDQEFVDGYEDIIIKDFSEHPDADAIKFYCESTNPERPLAFKKPLTFCKAKKRNLMSAGVVCLAVKRDFLTKNSIMFKCGIGPGQEIVCGEDSVFLNELFKNKANVYLSPELLSYIHQGDSSWFNGYDKRVLFSIGYIYDCIYGDLSVFLILRRVFRFDKSECALSKKQIFDAMMDGRKKHRKQF